MSQSEWQFCGSYLACGGEMRRSLVAVRLFIFGLFFDCRKWSFFTAVSEWCFCVAGAAFQGLIACGGKTAFLFSIACGGKKSIACGGKWVSLMPGYIKPIACGSKLLCSTCAHTWRYLDEIFLVLTRRFLYSLPTRTLRYALSFIHVISAHSLKISQRWRT